MVQCIFYRKFWKSEIILLVCPSWIAVDRYSRSMWIYARYTNWTFLMCNIADLTVRKKLDFHCKIVPVFFWCFLITWITAKLEFCTIIGRYRSLNRAAKDWNWNIQSNRYLSMIVFLFCRRRRPLGLRLVGKNIKVYIPVQLLLQLILAFQLYHWDPEWEYQ